MNAPAPMVFMSYRRGVTSPYAGRLEDAINRRFGNGTVFIDSNVEPAVDFVDGIKQALRTCRVMLVVIGPKWAALKGRRGPRLSEPGDFVRLEVETGLQNPEMTVIPLLVKGARMPHPDQLPASLRGLPNLQGLELSERLDRWNDDVGRLLKTLEPLLPENCSAHGTGTVPDFPSTGDPPRSAIAAAPRTRDAARTRMPLPPPLARRGRPRLARGLWVAALVAAVGAAVTGAIAARPDLFDDPAPRGSLTIVRTLRNQTLHMFEGKASTPADDVDLGVIIEVRRAGEDVPANGCHLTWTWLDKDGPAPVSDPASVSQEAVHVRPDAQSCFSHARVWVPMRASLDGYRHVAVQLDLYAADQLLGSDVTEVIPLG